jgi:hypothetical protein
MVANNLLSVCATALNSRLGVQLFLLASNTHQQHKAARHCLILALLVLLNTNSWAHEDFDLGIKSVGFTNQCHLAVIVQNFGSRALPKTFYLAENPAYIELRKNGSAPLLINSKSLSKLDSKRSLHKPGGQLHLEIPEVITNNPAPLHARLWVQGEFWDYGQKNDHLVLTEDCEVGKGGKPGHALPKGPADLALDINQITGCTIEFSITNVNIGIIQANAYEQNPQESIVLSPYNRSTQTRLQPILLKDLDKRKSLLNGQARLRTTLPKADYTLSLWQVKDDGNFTNNHQDVSLSACTAK